MKKEKGSSSWPTKGLPCKWTGSGRVQRQVRIQNPLTSDQRVKAEHHTYVLKEIPINWEWTDWLLRKRKGTGRFQCKVENKRSVELVIEAPRFKGLCRVSYLLPHKSLVGQRCPFLNLVLNASSQGEQGLIRCVIEDVTNVTAGAILQ